MRRGAVVAGVVVLAAVAVALFAGRGGGELDPPSAVLPGYRIAYRVEVFAQAREESRRDLAVRRPYDSRDITTAPGSDEPTTGFVASGPKLYALQGANKAVDVGERPRQAAPGDLRFGAELDDLVRLGLARRRTASARVAGRACTVYRFGSPLGDPLKKVSAAEYADLCIDGDGLVLREQWYLDGKLLRRTTATSVSTSVPPAASLGIGDIPVTPAPTGRGAVQSLSTHRPPVKGLPYWVARQPPWGFVLRERVRAVTAGGPDTGGAVQDVAYVDTYTRGGDVVTVEHREAVIAPEAGEEMEKVDGGKLGTGDVTLTPQGPAIRFSAGKWVVTVSGTLDVDHVRAFARRLRATGP